MENLEPLKTIERLRAQIIPLSLEVMPSIPGKFTQTVSVRSADDLRPLIEHTNLQPDATHAEIQKLCHEAKENGFFGVCVHPGMIEVAKRSLSGSSQKVVTVIGFPLGATTTKMKEEETKEVISMGADEVDMVLPLGYLKQMDFRMVLAIIKTVVKAAAGIPVKVILETALLTDDLKIAASLLAQKAGAHFVKTSTGFAKTGATVADVRLMRATVGTGMGVKAAGGIRNLQTALAMVQAGANRLGCSASTAIVTEGVSR